MKRTILLSAVAAWALGAGAAFAADMPARAPVVTKAPPAIALFNWSGFYVGGQLGYLWGDNDFVNITGAGPAPFDVDGVLAGGHVGANFQNGTWVYGVEADANWSNADGDDGGAGGIVDALRLRAEGSVRARLGVANNNVLYYVTGGWAWANVRHTDSAGFALTDTLNGWTAGGGVAVAATPNWIWALEYRYSDYGSVTGTGFNTVRHDLNSHQITARASWKM
ncbi:MAG: porin family protein [Bradyrhizobiaceae bacterium]|nr:porin family protein [Bradyrhizobiaceae bacterium]